MNKFKTASGIALLFLGVCSTPIIIFVILLFDNAPSRGAAAFTFIATPLIATAAGYLLLRPLKEKNKWLSRCAYGLMGLFILQFAGGILIHVVEDYRGEQAWENFKQEWEAKGEVFDYKQVIPKPVPTEKNFAHIPLLKPLLEHNWNDALTEATPRDPQKHEQAQNLMKIEGSRRPDFGRWVVGQPADLAAWQKFFREEEGWPHPEKAGDPAADVLSALGKFEATMTELTRAAKERPLCRYDIKYEAHFAMLLSHLAPIRRFVRSFTLRALAHLGNDDSESCLADVRMCLFLAESVGDEPTLISQLIRIASLQLALQPVWEGLKGEKWNAEQLAVIEKQLAAIDLLEGYRISMLGERDFANLAVDQLASNPKALSGILNETGNNLAIENFKIGLPPHGWILQNQSRLNEMHVRFTQRIIDTKVRRIHPDIEANLEAEIKRRAAANFPIYDMLSGMLIPGIGKVANRIGWGQTAVDHARIACLLEQHRMEQKKYPAQLAELKSPLPRDVYTGKPYLYKADKEGRYQLYGVGWNQKDDRGKVVLTDEGGLNPEMGDLVWSYSPQSAAE
ncbi:MAG: hypothetical protein VX988_03380 [Planctomycetota bacterium]|nr:hypothetical protein [Planctomycetota bacterium]